MGDKEYINKFSIFQNLILYNNLKHKFILQSKYMGKPWNHQLVAKKNIFYFTKIINFLITWT